MAYKPTGKPNGRPSTYTKKLADKVCEFVSGGDSLRSALKRKGMPSKTSFLRWVRADKDGLLDQYARARELLIQDRADELIDIADGDGTDTPGQAILRDRLKYDARKWELTKLIPKKYGDKTTLEHQGKDGGAINISISKDDAAHLGLTGEDDDEDS